MQMLILKLSRLAFDESLVETGWVNWWLSVLYSRRFLGVARVSETGLACSLEVGQGLRFQPWD